VSRKSSHGLSGDDFNTQVRAKVGVAQPADDETPERTPGEVAAAAGADGGARGPEPKPDPVERFNAAIRDWGHRGRI
jgi:hypothetical protein